MTKPTFFVEEDKILTSLFDAGLDNLHLNKTDASPMYIERLLTLLASDWMDKITVHSHYYLKEEYHLRGIHIDAPDAQPPHGYRGKLSRTCSDIDKLKETKREADYVLLGNLFDSQTDPNQKAAFTANQLEEASRRGLIDRHVYALGGMNIDNVRMARELGFGGVVICGDLWNKFDIHQQTDFHELLAHFEKLQKAID